MRIKQLKYSFILIQVKEPMLGVSSFAEIQKQWMKFYEERCVRLKELQPQLKKSNGQRIDYREQDFLKL